MSYVIFKLEKNFWGVPIESVREILTSPQITPIPQAPSFVEGLTNLRGHPILVVNLRKRLGHAFDKEQPYDVLMVKLQNKVFGIMVDKVLSISEIEPRAGVCYYEGKEIFVLQPETVLEEGVTS